MRITEIYKSIQGESSWAGLPCIFIRATACNLRCVWCDSAYSFFGGAELTLDQILSRVKQLDCKLITLTGGEPLLQPETPELARRLLNADCTVLVETSGEQPIEVLPEGAIRIMDFKCPDSGMSEHNRAENIAFLKPCDEVKFVLASRRDYEWARDQILAHKLHERVNAVLLSIAFGKLESASVVAWMLADKLPARFQLQMHKFIWAPETRGV
ncbi:MAG: radical SAM protein [Planctomycetota bacterium]